MMSKMLRLNLSGFAMSSRFSDVTIVIGDEKLFAHKIILGAASPIWLSMLTSPVKEGTEDCIVFEDIEINLMKAILKYLYIGKNEELNELEMASKALVVAEKYEMKKFKSLCEQALLNRLLSTNVLRILELADTYRAETLKQGCMEFIIERPEAIINTEDSEDFFVKKPRLVQQLLISFIRAIKTIYPIQFRINHGFARERGFRGQGPFGGTGGSGGGISFGATGVSGGQGTFGSGEKGVFGSTGKSGGGICFGSMGVSGGQEGSGGKGVFGGTGGFGGQEGSGGEKVVGGTGVFGGQEGSGGKGVFEEQEKCGGKGVFGEEDNL